MRSSCSKMKKGKKNWTRLFWLKRTNRQIATLFIICSRIWRKCPLKLWRRRSGASQKTWTARMGLISYSMRQLDLIASSLSGSCWVRKTWNLQDTHKWSRAPQLYFWTHVSLSATRSFSSMTWCCARRSRTRRTKTGRRSSKRTIWQRTRGCPSFQPMMFTSTIWMLRHGIGPHSFLKSLASLKGA